MDWISLSGNILAILISVITLIGVFRANDKVQGIHISLNSRLDKLLLVTAMLANKEGREQLLAEQKELAEKLLQEEKAKNEHKP